MRLRLFTTLLFGLLTPTFTLGQSPAEVELAMDRPGASVRQGGDEEFFRLLVDEESFGLLRAQDANAFTVYSKRKQRWDTHKFPEYLSVRPVTLGEFGLNASEAIIGFEYSGGAIPRLVVVDTKGRFRHLDLKRPIEADLRPVLSGNGILYYIADGRVHAFSGVTGTWDVLEAPQLPDVRWESNRGTPPSIQEHGFDTESTDGIVVHFPEYTAEFQPAIGVWQFRGDTRDVQDIR